MPYGISNSQSDCAGWAAVKKTSSGYETIGCHSSKKDAIDQMVAVSLAEGLEPLGEIGKRSRRSVGEVLVVDIDDTILTAGTRPMQGVIDAVHGEESTVILLTARPESERSDTVDTLSAAGVQYDMLIMYPEDGTDEVPKFKHDAVAALLAEGMEIDAFIDNEQSNLDAVAQLGVDVYLPEQFVADENGSTDELEDKSTVEGRYNPNQPRDGDGKWTSTGGMGAPEALDGAEPTHLVMETLIGEQYMTAEMSNGIDADVSARRSKQMDRVLAEDAAHEAATGEPDWETSFETLRGAQNDYQGDKHRLINAELRGTVDSDLLEDFSDEDYGLVGDYTSALDTLIDRGDALPVDTTVYRGVRWDMVPEFQGLEVGDTITDHGFLSTTMNPKIAVSFAGGGGGPNGIDGAVIRIKAPAGTKAWVMPPIGEAELLLPRGTQMRVTGFSRKVIDVEIVGVEQRSGFEGRAMTSMVQMMQDGLDRFVTPLRLTGANGELRYNPNQPRDGDGKWTSSGGMGGAADDALWTEQGTGGSQKAGALLLDQQEEYISSLDGDTHSAIGSYTGSGYKSINRTLRGAPPPPVTDPDSIASSRRMAARVDTAVRNAPPLEQDVLVFRGASRSAMRGVRAGDTVQDNGIMSTSTSSVVAGGFASDADDGVVMAIRVPKGSRALYVDDISSSPGEDEVLLPMGTKMRMMGKLADGTIKMEVVQ